MIRLILNLYILVLIANSVLSYFPPHIRLQPVPIYIRKISELTCAPIRKLIPANDFPFDFSPLVVLILIQLLKLLW